MADFSQPLIILVALLGGMLSRAIGLPALIGYLAAGFVLHELGTVPGPWLSGLADLGITLLLFSIGLKLDARKLLEQKVWGTTVVHMLVSQGILMAGLLALTALLPGLGLSLTGAAVIAFALTFSSTVFVIQTMQERGELQSNHAVLAVGFGGVGRRLLRKLHRVRRLRLLRGSGPPERSSKVRPPDPPP